MMRGIVHVIAEQAFRADNDLAIGLVQMAFARIRLLRRERDGDIANFVVGMIPLEFEALNQGHDSIFLADFGLEFHKGAAIGAVFAPVAIVHAE